MSLALSNCVLIISLMQSVNRAQFFNITFLLLLFGAAAVLVFGTVIVSLTCIRLISQSFNGISSVFYKLLRYFNGTIISTSF